jgi:hypothetical protein
MIEIANKEKQLRVLEDEIAHCKSVAEDCRAKAEAAWMTMGKDLCKIRDGELYPQHTFEQYCLQRWDIKRAHAYRLMNTYLALKDRKMSPMGDTDSESVPTSELSGQAGRALAHVPEDKREEVLSKAVKSGKVTGKSVRQAAAQTFRPDVIEKDRIGRDIPTPAMTVWNRRKELNPKLRPLYELKQWAQDMQGTDDILLSAIDFGSVVRQLGQLILTIQQGIPDVVCTKCQGQAPKTCTFCKGRGMVPISKARAYTPVEMKEIIEKQTSENDRVERLSSTGR